MALLTVQQVGRSGLNPSFVAGAATNDYPNDGRTQLIVKNGGASSITATPVYGRKCDQNVLHTAAGSDVVTIPAGQERWLAYGREFINDSGQTRVALSDVTSVTVAAVRFAKG
jgi:hypothetical protein